MHVGDLRSGIGSSSSFTVGLLKALLSLNNQNISKNKLANMACHIDHFAAICCISWRLDRINFE